ncbi:MAG: DUF2064 domain-containing protein [Pseudomonadota bacterium]
MATAHNPPPLLVLVCKRPSPGVGKQRIAAILGKERTAELAERLLACALEDLRSWPHATAISIASEADLPWARAQLPTAEVVAQKGGNLGERISDTCRQLDTVQRPVLLIGSDAPELSSTYLKDCLRALDHADVVLGQAEDGGVVVMGAKTPWPALDSLPWSTAALGAALQAQCENCGLTVAVRPPLCDIDRYDQLDDLAHRIASDERPARRELHRWLTTQMTAESRTRRMSV